MAEKWVKPGDRVNPLRGQSALAHTPIPDGVIAFNFAHLDATQGQTLEAWEKEGLLSQLLTRLKNHGTKTLPQCFHHKSFKAYPYFPPKSDFKHPKHISEDAKWASMHLNGRVCIGGHIVKNVFFVVFLDAEHRFWISELKHT